MTLPAGRPVELELKYAVLEPDDLLALLAGETVGSARCGPWRVREIEDLYVDTADRRLQRAGYGARLRRGDGASLLTVKSRRVLGADEAAGEPPDDAASPALHRREEYEAPVGDDDGYEPERWEPSAARDVVLRYAAGMPLVERFRLRQRRRERDLTTDAGRAVLSLDDVSVVHHDRLLGSFSGLEIELAEGDAAVLGTVGAVLDGSGVVEPEERSKEGMAEELVALAEGAEGRADDPNGQEAAMQVEDGAVTSAEDPDGDREDGAADAAADARAGAPAATEQPGASHRPSGPERAGVRREDSLAEAGRKVLRLHFERMLAREAATRGGEDPEGLKKMRVATRRMRAAWRVFQDAYEPRLTRRSVAGLREVAGRLGTVRDLDVQIDALDAWVEARSGDGAGALGRMRDAWLTERDGALRDLLLYLDSPGYGKFVRRHERFVSTPGMGIAEVDGVVPVHVRDTAGSRVWAAYERLRAHERTLAWADVEQLHAVRIDAKRFRYTLEAFRDVLGGETDWLIERVVALQDHLGALNDADIAAIRTRRFLVAESASLSSRDAEALGDYLTARERETTRRRRTLAPVWRPISSPAFRRALARSISAL